MVIFYADANNLVPPLIDISEYIKTCTTYIGSDPWKPAKAFSGVRVWGAIPVPAFGKGVPVVRAVKPCRSIAGIYLLHSEKLHGLQRQGSCLLIIIKGGGTGTGRLQ